MAGGEIAAIIGEVLKWVGIIGGPILAIVLGVNYAEKKGAAEDDVEELEAEAEEQLEFERERAKRRREAIEEWKRIRAENGR